MDDREPGKKLDAETVQSVMKEEVPGSTIRVWKVEDRVQYSGRTPDLQRIRPLESISVIVGYVKDECRSAVCAETRANTRAIKEIRLPFDDPNPTNQKVKEALEKAVMGDVKIIQWKNAPKIQNGALAGPGKLQVRNEAEIEVQYMGGSLRESPETNGGPSEANGESADKKGKMHRLLFRHVQPDSSSIRERMLGEVGNCTVVRWDKDESLSKKGSMTPRVTRIIVEYLEKK